MTLRICFGLIIALAAGAARGGEGFIISYWCGPPAKFTTLERYQEIKEAGFTVALNCCSGLTVEQNRRMLDYCQQVGIKAIVMDSRMVTSIGQSAQKKAALDAIIKDYNDHPALFGYHITDEPGAGAFAGLGEVVGYLKEKDPRHPGYINLLPTYGGPLGVLGTNTYEEYVRQFVQKVKPFAISYDHYHFTNEGDRADFFENLATVRKVALESKLPFWNIVLCTQHGGYRHLTEPELRFEAMQTLAFGAQGLLWFTYWSPADVDKTFEWKHAMINPDGSRDPHYDMVKAINADVKAIGDLLANAESVAVIQPNEKSAGGIAQSGPGTFTIGVFKTSDGKSMALVTNRDYKQAIKSQVTIAHAKVEQFDPAKKSWSPAGEGDVVIKLPAGGGILLRW